VTFLRYTKHLKQFHEMIPGFRVTCKIDGCRDSFTTVRYFVRHVNRKHKTNRSIDCDAVTNEGGDDDVGIEVDEETDIAVNNSDNGVHVAFETMTQPDLDQTVHRFEKHIAQCILKLREKHILPVNVQQDVIAEMQLITSHIHDTYRSMFLTFCEEQQISFDDQLPGMGRYLSSNNSVFTNIFTHLDSEYKLNKFITTNFAYVKPQDMVLGHNPSGKPAKFSYVSICSVLELALSNDDIRHHILSRSADAVAEDCLACFTDGTVFRDHAFFAENPNALRLHFYLDEFEVCNPIGSKRGKHKVLAVYYIIGNLDPQYCSEIKFINLCILVRYQHLQQFDPHCAILFEPLIKELEMLAADGIDIKTEGNNYNFRAALATVSADNLSAHALAGFQRHFNSGRICRFCMAHYDEIRDSFREDAFVVRNKEVHAYHLQALEVDEANGPVYGVLHRCPLLDLPYFDVTAAFVPDIMHDMLEGVIPQVMVKVIQKAVQHKLVTVDVLNDRLNVISRGVNDRPNPFNARMLTGSGSVVGSASQKWQLYVMLPRLLGTYLDENDVSWEVYLLLREITDIVFAPVVSTSSLSYLDGVISEFLTRFVSVFGTSLTPKFHYLIHYPRLIKMYGPLRKLWCMRFEAKHQYFKSVVSSLGNYINVAGTMAQRHQMRQCLEFSSHDLLHSEPFCVSTTKALQMSYLPAELRFTIAARLQADVDVTDAITVTQRLRKSHITYAVNSCYVVGVVEQEEIPVYFQVKYIVLFRDTWILCGRLCFCSRFCRHIHAYKVNIDNDWAVVYPGEELDYNPHDFFVVDGCSFVSSRYHLPARMV